MDKIREHVLAIIIGTIIAVFGGIGTYYFVEYQNRIDYISYEVIKSDNLLAEISGQTDLRINKRSVTNIGYVTVKLYNNTNRDFDTFDCDLVVKSKKGIKIQNVDFEDVNKSKERVRGTFEPIEDTVQTKRSIHFVITPLNRSEEPGLVAKLVIEDIDNINCSIQFQKVGVEPKLLDTRKQTLPGPTRGDIMDTITISSLGTILGLVVLSFFRVMQKKKNDDIT